MPPDQERRLEEILSAAREQAGRFLPPHSRTVQPWIARLAALLVCSSVLVTCPACRTFKMTEEEFQKQQQGIYHESPNEEEAWWCLGEVLKLLGPWLSGK